MISTCREWLDRVDSVHRNGREGRGRARSHEFLNLRRLAPASAVLSGRRKVTAIGSNQSGLYRFVIETGTAGTPELNLNAKVPGEDGPVAGKITYDIR
jgi:hypothetical protein